MSERKVHTITKLKPDDQKLPGEKIKVAAYARVSSDHIEQEDSFERQKEHYTQLIQANPNWEFVKVYADDGITGTRADKRPGFQEMIQDCRDGKIQKIMVKSISRFARNTIDSLQYIQLLRELGVGICFESENIDTMTTGGEVLITILSAIAEQESRTISSNIRWAYQRKFQSGDVLINTGLMLGYKKVGKDRDGHNIYEIVEEEAKIVRLVFRKFLAGYSIKEICKELEKGQYETKIAKKKKWSYGVIAGILKNEKYTGNAILGKTYKRDVLSKTRRENDGLLAPLYYVEGSHPPIIEQTLFDAAKKEWERRKVAKTNAVGLSRYNTNYPFSGLLICGVCGHKLRRHIRISTSKKKIPYWGCSNLIVNRRAACDSHYIREDVLIATYQAAMASIMETATEITDAIRTGLDTSLEAERLEQLARINEEILEIQDATSKLYQEKIEQRVSNEEYAAKIKEFSERVKQKEEEKKKIEGEAFKYTEIRSWLEEFDEQFNGEKTMTDLDKVVLRAVIEKIVCKDDGIELYLKCGAVIGQGYVYDIRN